MREGMSEEMRPVMSSLLALLLIHLIGNAVLLWLGYRWLGMDESNRTHLLGSLALAAFLLLGFAWLHGFALATFSGLPLRRAAARSLSTLLPITLVCLLAIAVYATLAWIQGWYAGPAFVLASFLTLHGRTAISPKAVETVFHWIVLALQWGIVPAALLLLAGRLTAARLTTASATTSTAHPFWRRSFLLFALLVAVLLLCAIWVPWKLFFWIPGSFSFNWQLASLVGRVGIGYLLFVFGVLALDFITASGKPAGTQPSTVVSP